MKYCSSAFGVVGVDPLVPAMKKAPLFITIVSSAPGVSRTSGATLPDRGLGLRPIPDLDRRRRFWCETPDIVGRMWFGIPVYMISSLPSGDAELFAVEVVAALFPGDVDASVAGCAPSTTMSGASGCMDSVVVVVVVRVVSVDGYGALLPVVEGRPRDLTSLSVRSTLS